MSQSAEWFELHVKVRQEQSRTNILKKKLIKISALTFLRNVTSLFSLLHINQYKIRSLIRTRVTVSVLDVKMGHALLGVFGLFCEYICDFWRIMLSLLLNWLLTH